MALPLQSTAIFTVTFLISFFALLTAGDPKSYAGYKLLRFTPQNEKEVRVLTTLVPDTEDGGISFWSEPRAIGQSVDVLVSPTKLLTVMNFTERNQLPKPEIVIQDVQK